MPAPDPEVFAKALEGYPPTIADTKPAITTMLQTNTPAGYVSITLPGEGDLWVEFSCGGTPLAKVWLWDQLKLFTPIVVSTPTVLETRKGNKLVYELGFAAQQMSLTWGYE